MIAHIKTFKVIYTRNNLLDGYELPDWLLLAGYELPKGLVDNELSE